MKIEHLASNLDDSRLVVGGGKLEEIGDGVLMLIVVWLDVLLMSHSPYPMQLVPHHSEQMESW